MLCAQYQKDHKPFWLILTKRQKGLVALGSRINKDSRYILSKQETEDAKKPSHATFSLIECEPAEENHEDKLKPKKKQQAEKKPAKEVKAVFQHKVQSSS
jgi:hypothetical protein